MPIFDSKEYLAIFPHSLMVDQTSPFDCYIFLPLSQKVVPFISAGQQVTTERLAKLSTHSHTHLFILATQREAYYQYLNEFLSTPAGQVSLQESLAKGETYETLGIPPEIEARLKQPAAPAPPETPRQPSQIKDPLLAEIFAEIQNKAQALEADILVRDVMTHDQRLTVTDVANSIDQELVQMADRSAQKRADFKVIVQGVTQKIQDEIIRVKGLKDLKASERQVIDSVIEEVNQEVEQLRQAENFAQAQSSQKRIQTQLKLLRGMSNEKPEDIFAHTLEQMIASVEAKLGKNLNLAVIPREEQLIGTHLVDPQLLENLKKLAGDHEGSLVSLTEKIRNIAAGFTDIKTQLFAHQTLLKRKLEASDQIKGKQILQQVQEFEKSFFSDLSQERKKLKSISSEFLTLLESRPLDPDAAASNDTEDIIPELMDLENLTSPAEEVDELGTTEDLQADSVERMSLIDQLTAENKVLQVQLENAQALADTTTKKVTELEELIASGGEYAKTIEEELQKSKKQNDALIEENQNLESEKRRLQEGIEDANNNFFKMRSSFEADEAKVTLLQDRIAQLEKTLALEMQKDNESERSLLLKKEQEFQGLQKKMTQFLEEQSQFKKEIASLSSEARKFEAERRDLGKRLEKQRAEQENAKQLSKVTEVKVASLTNLLANARKTIGKFTSENEELRQDRLKYIKKTNEALADHKSLVGQSLSLNNQLQNEIQKNKNLEQSLEQARLKERSLAKEIQSLQSQLNIAEQEKKKVETDLRKNSQNSKANESDALKIQNQDLEKRIEILKRENQEMQARFSEEQRKVIELTQKIRKKSA